MGHASAQPRAKASGAERPRKEGLCPYRGCHLGPASPGARQQTYCLTWLIFANPNFTNGLLSPPGPRLWGENPFPLRAPQPSRCWRTSRLGVIKNNPPVSSFCCCLFILQSRVRVSQIMTCGGFAWETLYNSRPIVTLGRAVRIL